MILRDFQCKYCKHIELDIFTEDKEKIHCPQCNKLMLPILNGGIKSRWRFADKKD